MKLCIPSAIAPLSIRMHARTTHEKMATVHRRTRRVVVVSRPAPVRATSGARTRGLGDDNGADTLRSEKAHIVGESKAKLARVGRSSSRPLFVAVVVRVSEQM